MIIYGWSAKNIKQAPLENHECPHCQQKQSVLVIFARYAHIFWIPLFPFKKSAVIVCQHCKNETDEKSIVLGAGVSVQQLKASVPMPKYLFAGLVILLVGIASLTYSGIQDSKAEQSYLQYPQVGDVYLIKSDDEPSEYNHYLLKVRDVAGDSLSVSMSSYFYNGIVTELDPKDGFYDVMYTIHKSSIQAFKESGDLKKVMRDYSASAGFDREIEYIEYDTLGTE